MLEHAEKSRVVERGASADLGLQNAHEGIPDRFVLSDAAARDEPEAFRGRVGAKPDQHVAVGILDHEIDGNKRRQTDDVGELRIAERVGHEGLTTCEADADSSCPAMTTWSLSLHSGAACRNAASRRGGAGNFCFRSDVDDALTHREWATTASAGSDRRRERSFVRATVEKIRAIAGGSADKPGLPRPTMVRAAG